MYIRMRNVYKKHTKIYIQRYMREIELKEKELTNYFLLRERLQHNDVYMYMTIIDFNLSIIQKCIDLSKPRMPEATAIDRSKSVLIRKSENDLCVRAPLHSKTAFLKAGVVLSFFNY